jgi:hypothetical protein
MSTVEDVFYLYERNSKYYFDCSQQNKLEECQNSYCNECYCFTHQIVQPITIGNQFCISNFNRKCYVKPGEECPICYEAILTKSSAYLTYCGHSFHKSCIFKAMETKWRQKYAGNFHCPICRSSLGTDLQDLNIRYKPGLNFLDDLENFWFSNNYILLQTCRNGWNHDVGVKSNCDACLKYRKYGNNM